MNFKFNFGHGAALALAFFVIFIGSFVYKTLMVSDYNHKLVSEKYYEEELNYQEEIDRQNNAAKLPQNIIATTSKKGLEFTFPPNFDYSKITGHIKLQRSSIEDDLDIERDFTLKDSILLISDKQLVKGRYIVKLDWKYDTTGYQFRKKIDY